MVETVRHGAADEFGGGRQVVGIGPAVGAQHGARVLDHGVELDGVDSVTGCEGDDDAGGADNRSGLGHGGDRVAERDNAPVDGLGHRRDALTAGSHRSSVGRIDRLHERFASQRMRDRGEQPGGDSGSGR